MHFDHIYRHQTTFSFEATKYLCGSHVDVVVSNQFLTHICSHALNSKGLCYFWRWRWFRCHFVFKFPYSRKFTTLFACIKRCLSYVVHHICAIWVCVKHLNVNLILWFERKRERESKMEWDGGIWNVEWRGWRKTKTVWKFRIFLVICFIHQWICVMQIVTPNVSCLGNVLWSPFARIHRSRLICSKGSISRR